MTTAQPRRLWFQFSLKGLMLMVLVAAIPCGWLKWKIDRKARERAAVAEIKRVGGYYGYDWQMARKGYDKGQPPGPVWLRKLLGDNFFSNVVSVSLVDLSGLPELTEEWLHLLEPLSELTNIQIGTPITDDGMRYLMRFTKVKELKLWTSGVTDSGLIGLNGLTQLEGLYLERIGGTDASVTDASLAQLKGLTKLKTLTLAGTGVTDAGLVHLRALTALEVLNLGDCRVCDAGLIHLERLPLLRELYLYETDVTDSGLVHLKGLTSLDLLYLYGTAVTDAGLVHLKGLTNLETLMLSHTAVTDAGIADLQSALPKCKILR